MYIEIFVGLNYCCLVTWFSFLLLYPTVMSFVIFKMLKKQLEALGMSSKPQMVSRFEEIYKQMWPANGDHISRIYAGTGAMTVGKSKVLSVKDIHYGIYSVFQRLVHYCAF